MGRPRKHSQPRLFVVGKTADEALARLIELRRLAPPGKKGRAVRLDRLREAMTIADSTSPRPAWEWRRKRGGARHPAVARREQLAVARLMAICAARGDSLTSSNATRIIEQARRLLDRSKAITPKDREKIEAAREILGAAYARGRKPGAVTAVCVARINEAATIVLRRRPCSEWDRNFLRLWQRAMDDGALNADIAG